ncbi:hypothetical protein Trydic_g5110 [Trypoxylus dichotomus]
MFCLSGSTVSGIREIPAHTTHTDRPPEGVQTRNRITTKMTGIALAVRQQNVNRTKTPSAIEANIAGCLINCFNEAETAKRSERLFKRRI